MQRISCISLLAAFFLVAGLQAQAQSLSGVLTTSDGMSTDVVVGASIRVANGSFDQTATTGSQGEFSLSVPEGSYQVTVSATGFALYNMDLSMPSTDKRVVLSIGPDTSPAPWDLCCIITETNGNGPALAGVLVEIIETGMSATSDAGGNLCIMNVPPGNDYHVRFSKPGYVTEIMALVLDGDKSIVFSLQPQ